MIKSELQTEFAREYNNGSKEVFLRNMFTKSEPMELKLNKDVSEFDLNEITELLKSLNSRSTESLRVKVCLFRQYTNYVNEKSSTQKVKNFYNDVTTEILEDSVNKATVENKFISRERLKEFMSELPNVCDQYVLYALYEGVKGERLSEITMTTVDGINKSENTIELYGGRTLVFDLSFIEKAIESGETYEYLSLFNNSLKRLNLIGERLFKVRDNVTQDDVDHAYKRGFKRIGSIKKYLGYDNITIPGLQISGLVEKIKELINEKELPLDEIFDSREFRELVKRYGYESYTLSRFKIVIKDYM